MIKKIITFCISTILLTLLLYGGCAFVTLEMDFKNWSEPQRVFFVIGIVFSMIISGMTTTILIDE